MYDMLESGLLEEKGWSPDRGSWNQSAEDPELLLQVTLCIPKQAV